MSRNPKSAREPFTQLTLAGLPPPRAGKRAHIAHFYSDQFTVQELARAATFETDITLYGEIWLQRVVNHRLFSATSGLTAPADDDEDEPRVVLLVKVAAALTVGTGRVARLLRDQRLLSVQVAASLEEATTWMLIEMERVTALEGVTPIGASPLSLCPALPAPVAGRATPYKKGALG